jgi:hypothetical protein
MRRLLLATLLALPVAGLAHHGWSEYDSSKLLKLSGKIVEAGYEHPHGHVRMENRGLPKEWLKAGASATVEGYPNRNKPEEMRAERITINGKTVELR